MSHSEVCGFQIPPHYFSTNGFSYQTTVTSSAYPSQDNVAKKLRQMAKGAASSGRSKAWSRRHQEHFELGFRIRSVGGEQKFMTMNELINKYDVWHCCFPLVPQGRSMGYGSHNTYGSVTQWWVISSIFTGGLRWKTDDSNCRLHAGCLSLSIHESYFLTWIESVCPTVEPSICSLTVGTNCVWSFHWWLEQTMLQAVGSSMWITQRFVITHADQTRVGFFGFRMPELGNLDPRLPTRVLFDLNEGWLICLCFLNPELWLNSWGVMKMTGTLIQEGWPGLWAGVH